eukprot:1562765-Amphidinium_carterae.1
MYFLFTYCRVSAAKGLVPLDPHSAERSCVTSMVPDVLTDFPRDSNHEDTPAVMMLRMDFCAERRK